MNFSFAYNGTPAKCSGIARPGCIALMRAVMAHYPGLGSFGIYSCRQSTAGKSLSIHADGRAWDAATTNKAFGDRIAADLIALATVLGIQRIIWWHREWDSRPGERDWEPYTGPNPHTNHLHIELCSAAAGSLTEAYVASILAGVERPAPPPPAGDDGMASPAPRTIRRGDSGQEVRNLQGLLIAHGVDPKKLGPSSGGVRAVDGDFGDNTDRELRAWQGRAGLVADGVCGPKTWGHLMLVPLRDA